MSDYDPTLDPRYIDPEPAMPAVERDRVQEHIHELAERIAMFDSILLVFQQPGWELLAQMYELTHNELSTLLEKQHDPVQWKFDRGQLVQVDLFLRLPDEIARRQRRFRQQFDDLTRLIEGGNDV